jgi:cytochrome b subunit of formate dehydrogenase
MYTYMIKYIIYIISIILGIIVGRVLFNKYNIKYHGPNSSNVKNTIHKKDGKCYIFEPHVYMCPII